MEMGIVFDLKNLNPGVKFFFDENDEKGSFVVLRTASAAALDNIRKQAVKVKPEYRNNPKTNRLERIEVIEIDEALQSRLLWDYAIMEWSIMDAEGKTIPCTADMKFLLMNESKVFSEFVSKCLDRLNEDESARQEAAAKNS